MIPILFQTRQVHIFVLYFSCTNFNIIVINLVSLTMFGEEHKLWCSSLWNLLLLHANYFLFRSKYFPHNLVPKHHRSLFVGKPRFTPMQKKGETDKIIILYISAFVLLNGRKGDMSIIFCLNYRNHSLNSFLVCSYKGRFIIVWIEFDSVCMLIKWEGSRQNVIPAFTRRSE